MSGAPGKLVILGRISGLYGLKGWLKLRSYTDPRESIVDFDTWILRGKDVDRRVDVETGKRHGRTVVAKLRSIDDREAAAALVGTDIAVERDALAPCEPGEYYWTDLEGCDVVTVSGQALGRLEYLFETGEHDVMVVAGDRQRLIPFVPGRVVREVELDEGRIVVDWDPSY